MSGNVIGCLCPPCRGLGRYSESRGGVVALAHAGIHDDSASCIGEDTYSLLDAVTEGNQRRRSVLRVAWSICFLRSL